MPTVDELLEAYAELWEERGEPPSKIRMNLNGDFYATDYTEGFDIRWEELPKLCWSEGFLTGADPEVVTGIDEIPAEDETSAAEPPGRDGESSTPPSTSLTVELYEIYSEVERPLTPTDLASHAKHSADQYQAMFGSWAEAGDRANVPVGSPSWREAVLRELQLYRASTDRTLANLQDLYDAFEARLGLLFPDNNHLQPKIRQQLQRLENDGEIEFVDGLGRYRLLCDPLDLDSEIRGEGPSTERDVDTTPEDLGELEADLRSAELLCEMVEAHIDADQTGRAGRYVQNVQQKLEMLGEEMADRKLPTALSDRYDEANRRTETAESEIAAVPADAPGSDLSASTLVDRVQDLTDRFGESPRPETVRLCGPDPPEAYTYHFESWERTLRAAGVDQIEADQRANLTYSRPDALRAVLDIALELGRFPSHGEFNKNAPMNQATAAKRFGGWGSARELVSRLTAETLSTTDGERDQGPEADEESSDADEDRRPSTTTEPAAEETEPVLEPPARGGESIMIADIDKTNVFSDPFCVQVVDLTVRDGGRATATMTVQDEMGDRAELNIWNYHQPEIDWEEGNWYILEEMLGKTWKDDEGNSGYKLSTTRLSSASHADASQLAEEQSPASNNRTETAPRSREAETTGAVDSEETELESQVDILAQITRDIEDL